MQEIPTFFDEEKELLEIDNDLSKKENLEKIRRGLDESQKNN